MPAKCSVRVHQDSAINEEEIERILKSLTRSDPEKGIHEERDALKLLMDKFNEDLIPNVLDPDSWEHEKELMNHRTPPREECVSQERFFGEGEVFVRGAKLIEGEEGNEGTPDCECDRSAGESCLKCCTKIDLEANPALNRLIVGRTVRNGIEEFTLALDAYSIGEFDFLG